MSNDVTRESRRASDFHSGLSAAKTRGGAPSSISRIPTKLGERSGSHGDRERVSYGQVSGDLRQPIGPLSEEPRAYEVVRQHGASAFCVGLELS